MDSLFFGIDIITRKEPDKWVKKKVKDIILEEGKSKYKVEDADNFGIYPFYTSGESVLKDSDYLVNDENLFLSTGGISSIKYYKGKANYSSDTFCIKSKIVTKFLYYLLLNNKIKIDYQLFLGSGLKHLQKNDFRNTLLCFPNSSNEQKKIAEILETVDEEIQKTDEIIKKYERIKKGLMQDLFSKGITAFQFEKDKLLRAVNEAFKNGDHKFGREENLVGHLKEYVCKQFLGWSIDGEVEKNNRRQRPDIIIHKRGKDENLFAIEVKKNGDIGAIKQDIKKLEEVMLGDYHYEDAIFIGFDIENANDVFKLSDNINFILVSENGEIKTKSRVRKLKDSPLGKIPEEWVVKTLKDVGKIIVSNVDKKINKSEKRVKLCNYMDVYLNNYIDNSINFMVASATRYEINKFCLELEDVIITKDSESPDDIAVPSVLYEKVSNLICGYHLSIIRPNKDVINGVFLMNSLKIYNNNLQFSRAANGSTRFGLSIKSIGMARVSTPSIYEQKRIISIILSADNKIKIEKKFLKKLERIKQGLMEDLLTGKVRVNHLIEEDN